MPRSFLNVFALLILPHALSAAPPLVSFDVNCTVACADVTPDEYAQTSPDRRIVEAVFRISPRLIEGSESDLKEIRYEIESPDRLYPIWDYAPRSTTATDIDGKIMVVKSTELRGKASIGYGVVPAAALSAEIAADQKTKVELAKLPPRQVLVASGKIERGHGLFFKLRPSSQTTLEEEREFACLLEVPKNWRADYFHVHCEAVGNDRRLVRSLDREVNAGLALFCVGLHREGDPEAQTKVKQLVEAQQVAFNFSAKHRKELTVVCDQSGCSVKWFSSKDHSDSASSKTLGPALFERLTMLGRSPTTVQIPPEVRHALNELAKAKAAVHALNTPARP